MWLVSAARTMQRNPIRLMPASTIAPVLPLPASSPFAAR
jgi:hypothetical protein